jgi:hypothetical protein
MLSQLLRLCTLGACARRCRACFAVRRCADRAEAAYTCEVLTCASARASSQAGLGDVQRRSRAPP